jgi:hypothetical protein
MPTAYETVKDAILNKLTIKADYQNHPREMCPHVIGRKRGREQALFYQFGGTSKSGLAPAGSPENWRCIPIAGLTNIRSEKGQWHTAPNHTRPQTCVDDIDVEVTY